MSLDIGSTCFECPRLSSSYWLSFALKRLKFLSDRLANLLDLEKPEIVALEDIFFAKNARSAFQLGVVRGVVISKCMDRRIKIFEYAPTTVKSVVTGSGKADKSQVRKMLGIPLGARFPESLAMAATDALALAICHAAQTRLGPVLFGDGC